MSRIYELFATEWPGIYRHALGANIISPYKIYLVLWPGSKSNKKEHERLEAGKELAALAKKKKADIYPVSPDDVVVSEWVRWKCMFGCKGYGKHLSCPPYVPGPEDTRKMLKEYKKLI